MDRIYYDVPNTLYIKCSVCGRKLLYTNTAIGWHESRCRPRQMPVKAGETIAPPPETVKLGRT